MIRSALAALACLGLGWLLYRTVAFSRKNRPTMLEQRKAVFGNLEPKYRYRWLHPVWWKVQITRTRKGRAA